MSLDLGFAVGVGICKVEDDTLIERMLPCGLGRIDGSWRRDTAESKSCFVSGCRFTLGLGRGLGKGLRLELGMIEFARTDECMTRLGFGVGLGNGLKFLFGRLEVVCLVERWRLTVEHGFELRLRLGLRRVVSMSEWNPVCCLGVVLGVGVDLYTELGGLALSRLTVRS